MEVKSATDASPVKVEVESVPSKDVKQLLEATIYGMKGEMQYRHSEAAARIDQLTDPHFVTLRKSGKVLGTAGFLNRKILFNSSSHNSYYVRYLSIPQTDRKVGKKHRKKNSKSNSILKSKVHSLFTQHFAGPFDSGKSPLVYYSYVEEKNEFSQSLCKSFGYEKVRTLSTLVVSRLYSKRNSNVKACNIEELKLVRTKLDREYADYTFYPANNEHLEKEYFIYSEDKEPVAGIRGIPVEWEILNIPGVTGLIIQYLLPYLPVFRRLFHSKKMKFVAFDAIWSDKGHEDKLIQLMESVLAEKHVTMGIVWVDSQSPIAEKILKIGKLGLLNKLKKDIPAHVMAKFLNVPDEEKDQYARKPAYICALDLI